MFYAGVVSATTKAAGTYLDAFVKNKENEMEVTKFIFVLLFLIGVVWLAAVVHWWKQ